MMKIKKQIQCNNTSYLKLLKCKLYTVYGVFQVYQIFTKILRPKLDKSR